MEVLNLQQSFLNPSDANSHFNILDTNPKTSSAHESTYRDTDTGQVDIFKLDTQRTDCAAADSAKSDRKESGTDISSTSYDDIGNMNRSLAVTPTRRQAAFETPCTSCPLDTNTSPRRGIATGERLSPSPARDAVERAMQILSFGANPSDDGQLSPSVHSTNSRRNTPTLSPVERVRSPSGVDTGGDHNELTTTTSLKEPMELLQSPVLEPDNDSFGTTGSSRRRISSTSTPGVVVDTSPGTASSAGNESNNHQDAMAPPPLLWQSPANTSVDGMSVLSPSVQGDIGDAEVRILQFDGTDGVKTVLFAYSL